MSVNVEQLLWTIEALAQREAERQDIRQRLRDDAQAQREMRMKVDAILKEMRDEAKTKDR